MAVFITPTEVSPPSYGGWVDSDCSSVVPAGATGVMIVVYSTSGTSYYAGARNNGSSDNRYRSMTSYQNYHYVGVDANRVCELFRGNAVVHFFAVGYFTDDAVFFVNGVDKSQDNTGNYYDVDISADTSPDTALAAVLEQDGGSGNYLTIRCNGSSDARYPSIGYHIPGGVIIGVDGSQIFEQKISSTSINLFLLGYIKSKVTVNINAVDKSIGSTGSYADLPALTAGAIGGMIEVYNGAANDLFALREKGASHDIYYDARRSVYATVECDSNRLVEGKIETTNVDFFEILVFTAATTYYSTPTGVISTITGSQLRAIGFTRLGTITSSGTHIQLITSIRVGVLSFSGSVIRGISTLTSGVTSISGSIIKGAQTILTSSLSLTGDLGSQLIEIVRKAISGATSISGEVIKSTATTLSSSLSTSGVVTKGLYLLNLGAIALSGLCSKLMAQVNLGVLGTIGILEEIYIAGGRLLTGTISISGALSRIINFKINLNGLINEIKGSLFVSGLGILLNAIITIGGRLMTTTQKSVSGEMSLTGHIRWRASNLVYKVGRIIGSSIRYIIGG